MAMEFMKNAPVFTAKHELVGHVARVVVDSQTKEVTHIVIRKGFIFAENKVLPISLIASGGEQIMLCENAGDLHAFPRSEERDSISSQ
jgi:uncharacterized protein YrrD